MWFTTSVAIALCTARDLSRDLDVASCAYKKSGTAMLESVEQVGIPSLTPKPVVGLPNWNRPNIQQWAYQAGLVRVGIPMDYLV